MPRSSANEGFSDRFNDAIDVASACGEPEAHFANDTHAAWGEVEDDYYEAPQTDVVCSSPSEVEDYYDSCNSADNDIRLR